MKPQDRPTPVMPPHRMSFRSSEDGSFVIFGLFLFLAMILVGGIAVDILRHDYARVRMQNTIDAAVLAAADLDQSLDPEAVVNDYFEVAGVGSSLKSVAVSSTINARSVGASASADVQTWFMRALGIDKMKAQTSGTAVEAIQDIEISMVLDVSGSMRGQRLSNLKTAAKQFVDTMLTDHDGTPITGEISINLVPYSTQVTLGSEFLDELNLVDAHGYSHCLEFRGSQFDTISIDPGAPIRQHAHFDYTNYSNSYDNWRVNSNRVDCLDWSSRQVTFLEDDRSILKSRIDAFQAEGWTSIEMGLKVGAGLLDPAVQPILSGHSQVKSDFRDRPYTMDRENTLKVLVVMSDGANTRHHTLAERFRGPKDSESYLWWKDNRWNVTVDEQERGFVDDDDRKNEPYYYAGLDYWGKNLWGGDSAVRMNWQDLFARVNMEWYAIFARALQAGSGDDNRSQLGIYHDYYTNAYETIGKATKDEDTKAVCAAAREQGILVYAIAFEISEEDSAILRDHCATNENYYYNVVGDELNYAFNAIATSLNTLQLVQ